MKVIITFTFYCNNLWKSIVYGSGKKPGKLGTFFLLLCGHPEYKWRGVFSTFVSVQINECRNMMRVSPVTLCL